MTFHNMTNNGLTNFLLYMHSLPLYFSFYFLWSSAKCRQQLYWIRNCLFTIKRPFPLLYSSLHINRDKEQKGSNWLRSLTKKDVWVPCNNTKQVISFLSSSFLCQTKQDALIYENWFVHLNKIWWNLRVQKVILFSICFKPNRF